MYFSSTLLAALLSISVAAASSSLPWPKEIVVVRRRSGLSHKEYLYYHALDWIFDSAFGANDSVPDQSYVGRDDVTELYGSSATSFTSPPPTDYIQTVIGPDGYNFNDLPTAFSMIAYETFPVTVPKCSGPIDTFSPVNAFFWASSTNPSIDNTTFATNLANALVNLLPANTIYNASIHVEVPGTDSRPYFGGYGQPTMNAVVKLWLANTNAAVTAVRAAQRQLNAANLSLNQDVSFIVFSRAHTIYDTTKNIPFDINRLTRDLELTTLY
ncbi:hypothetical protein MBLNU459_g5262t2 [Dothideomycetes sp. NU459]